MTIGVACKCLKIIGAREARNLDRVPQARSAIKDNIRIEQTITSN